MKEFVSKQNGRRYVIGACHDANDSCIVLEEYARGAPAIGSVPRREFHLPLDVLNAWIKSISKQEPAP